MPKHLIQSKAIPQKAFTDAVHIAISASNGIPFIASWNFKHIVGAVVRRNIEDALRTHVKLRITMKGIADGEECEEGWLVGNLERRVPQAKTPHARSRMDTLKESLGPKASHLIPGLHICL
jgi:hypothetical protein